MRNLEMYYEDFWRGHGFTLRKRRLELSSWGNFLAEHLSYVPSSYSNASVSYQLAYQIGAGGEWVDLSAILCKGGSMLAILPLSISKKDGDARVSSHGLPVLQPLFSDGVAPRLRKTCVKLYLDVLQNLARLAGCPHWISEEILIETAKLSEWHVASMQRGARATLHHELFVDLKLPLEEIKAHTRRSYRNLINVGLREWSSEVWYGSQCNWSQWEEFRRLHLQVAGKMTRALSTWEQQFEAVKSKQSLVVALRDAGDKLVGAALFALTQYEASYSVGAYNRLLFDKPVGHVAQFIAIQEFQRLGLSWYRIGARPFAADDPVPSAKDLSIADFKQGFATCSLPKIRLRHLVEESKMKGASENGE